MLLFFKSVNLPQSLKGVISQNKNRDNTIIFLWKNTVNLRFAFINNKTLLRIHKLIIIIAQKHDFLSGKNQVIILIKISMM